MFAILQLAQPFGLSGVYALVLGALFVKRRITKTVFSPDLLDRHTGLGLPQETDDLLFAVFAWFAYPSCSRLMDFLENVWYGLWGQVKVPFIWTVKP